MGYYQQDAENFFEFKDRIPVSKAIELLNLKEWEVGFILIHGQHASMEPILKENDELTPVAPLAGG